MAPRVWLITGTSSGFGGELVKVVLEKGDICVATARNPSKLSFQGESSQSQDRADAERIEIFLSVETATPEKARPSSIPNYKTSDIP